MKPKVYVSRKIPEEGLKALRKECDVEVSPHDRVLTKQELIHNIQGKDGLLCLLTDPIDAEILNSNPKIRAISNYAVGFNNIDLKACTERQIPVSNTPGVLTDTVADHAMTLILSIARRVIEADKFVRAGKYQGWAPMMFLGSDVNAKTLGILGLGRIGKAVAQRAAKGFGMKIIYYDVFRNKDFEKEYGAKYAKIEDVLKNADFVTVHVPLLPQTRHLIGIKQLNIMKRTAYLINTSRGPVVDEEALVHALKHGVIAGAGLDVFEDEPSLKPGLSKLDNVVITPHIASATKETRGAMAVMAAENLIAALKGKTPPQQLNKEVEVGLGFKYPFHTCYGSIIKNAAELANVLENMNEGHYSEHVTPERNDFATWVNDVLKDKELAAKLKKAKGKTEALAALRSKLNMTSGKKAESTAAAKNTARKKAAKKKAGKQATASSLRNLVKKASSKTRLSKQAKRKRK